MSEILELFGEATAQRHLDWHALVREQWCPYRTGVCRKIRKSQPEIAIGTCSVTHGKTAQPIMICPFRLLERRQIFLDCIHLLRSHEPGNALHIVPEVTIPGGTADYFLASMQDGKAVDFVGVELQTLDTTGSLWPTRQRFLQDVGALEAEEDPGTSPYGMNWKHTAKTLLLQMHHKIQTFEALNRHLVLAVENQLLHYLRQEFAFDHVGKAHQGDSMQFHAYELRGTEDLYTIRLADRSSTDATGLAIYLGLKAEPKIDLLKLEQKLERRISSQTRFRL